VKRLMAMQEFKIKLRPLLNDTWDGDSVTLLTSDPQASLDEWLASHYEPLATFQYLPANRNHNAQLISKTTPDLRILIDTACVTRTEPHHIIDFGTKRTWLRKL